jgi:23S rRNA (cytosine1962-C5)-methyltransferase
VAPTIDEPSDYVLLDLGDGRQLARLGPLVVDRPFPAVVEPLAHRSAWATADLRYERPTFGGDGHWIAAANEPPEAWTMGHAGLTFELRPTPSGQVGFFGEQIEPWRWIRTATRDLIASGPSDSDPPARGAVLNLFAYTGGSTLGAAAQGAAVTHVDASRSAVAWARRNATLSGMADAPIRWIVDDALTFVRREARRDRRYSGLILDAPSYGHGPRGERWTLEDHLPLLLDACLAIADRPGFILLTAHAEGLRPEDLSDQLAIAMARAGRRADAARVENGELTLTAASGNRAPAGVFARWRA